MGMVVRHSLRLMSSARPHLSAEQNKARYILQRKVLVWMRSSVLANKRYKKTLYMKNFHIIPAQTTGFVIPTNHHDFQRATDLEIQDILKEIIKTNLNQSTVVIDDRLHDIESECINRIYNDCVASHLLYADLFFCANYPADRYFNVLFRWYSCVWKHLSLEPTNVVQLLFYLARFRSTHIELLRQIETFLCDHIDCLLPLDMAMVCYAFASTNTSFTNYRLLVKIADMLLEGLKSGTMPVHMCSNVLKTLHSADYSDVGFYMELGNILQDDALLQDKDLTIPKLKDILLTYTFVKIYHPKMLQSVINQLQTLIEADNRAKRDVRFKDCSNIIFCCITFNIEVPEWIIRRTVYLLSNTYDPMNFHEVFALSVANLTKIGIYPRHLLNVVLSPEFVNKMKGEFNIFCFACI